MRNWLLPEYIEDILPAAALHIETMRRQIIDLLFVHGYQQVTPPMLEYVESLLTGSGSDMDLQMFKVIDQLSGRMLGVRADMTPQVARIDAHLLNCDGITRLCYAHSVLHTVPTGITQTREPFQIGAELYGHTGLESDLEIQQLMLQCLAIAGVDNVYLDLGHVAIVKAIIKNAAVSPAVEVQLFDALQTKDVSTLQVLTEDLDQTTREALLQLPELYGDKKILAEARHRLPDYPEISAALDELETIDEKLCTAVNTIIFDLADLRGYHYHTGIVFTAYSQGRTNAIAYGGRYDEIGKAFGRARPATGFSMNLRELARLGKTVEYPKGIAAPYFVDEALNKTIAALRERGEVVVIMLPGQQEVSDACDRQLVHQNGEWVVEAI